MFKVIIMFVTLSSFALAKTAARVLSVDGKAFVFGLEKQVEELSYGKKIPVGSQVMVEDEGSLTLRGEDGAIYHMAAGASVKLHKETLELKNGTIWVSLDKKLSKVVFTSNSKVQIARSGEYVVSFNSNLEKSQLLSIVGEASLSNLVQEGIAVKVYGGNFSLVSSEYSNGLPRAATHIGNRSYTMTKSLFKKVAVIQNLSLGTKEAGYKDEMKRSIASVSKIKKAKIRFVEYDYVKTPARTIASVKKSKKIKKLSFKKEKVAKVRVFKLNLPKAQRVRKPASVSSSIVRDLETVSVFEKSLRKTIKSNPKNTIEVNSLIDELNSYKEDFQKDY